MKIEKTDKKQLSIGILKFSDNSLSPASIHHFRGYIGNLFREYDLVHNHNPETGKTFYRYPLIQFKCINDIPVILAITDEAVEIFKEIFLKINEIIIRDVTIPVHEKQLEINEYSFGISENPITYSFISPWIGLNQKNFKSYSASAKHEKEQLLERCLIGNIISMSKYLDYTVPAQIKVETNLKEKKVNLKEKEMLGFTGYFKTNFLIPDFLGIGKSVSRGFGTVKKLI